MRENDDRREDRDEDEDLQELKRRRNRHDDNEDRVRGRSHKTRPSIEKFQIWFQMGNSTVTADYVTHIDDYSASDLEDFVDDLLADDFRLYKKQYKKDRGGSGNYGSGRSNYRGRRYED
jgi:hypothetical protein